MLLSRNKAELEASMENAIFTLEEIPQVVESFSRSHSDISKGRLEGLVSGLNNLKGDVFIGTFEEEDFKDASFITDQNGLSSYASATGFYPYAVGFVFPHFESIVGKVLHHPRQTRGFYVNRNYFRQPPFSDTGVVFVDGNELEITFMHYKELTNSSQFQYSKTHQLGYFAGSSHLRLAYELELALLREVASIFVQNKEFSRFRGISIGSVWSRFWDSLKKEFYANYLPTYKKMVGQLGGFIPEDLESDLKGKIDCTFDLMKPLLHRDTKEIVDIFFRFGTIPDEMMHGRLYSPLNDMIMYLK